MRIVHLIDTFHWGALYQEGELARAHALAGHETWVIAMEEVGRRADLPFAFRLLPSVPTPRHQRLPIALGRVLRGIAPDLVVAHNLGSLLTLSTVVSPRRDYCLVVDCHNSVINTRTGGLVRSLARSVFRQTFGELIARRSDHVVAVGSPERDFAVAATGMPGSRIPIIPLGADCDLFRPRPEAERKAARAELGIPDDAFCVVHAGRLVPEKGILELAAAAARLEGYDPTILVVGELDLNLGRELRRSRIDVRIVHRPSVPKPALARYLAAADAGGWLANPSITVIEAMATGLPIVAARRPHFEALLGQDGLLVETQDQATDALRRLAADTEMRRTIGRRNRDIAIANHSWGSIARAFEALCQRN